jgi:hypothetical protein
VAGFDRWSKRLVQTLGKQNLIETIERLHELKRITLVLLGRSVPVTRRGAFLVSCLDT